MAGINKRTKRGSGKIQQSLGRHGRAETYKVWHCIARADMSRGNSESGPDHWGSSAISSLLLADVFRLDFGMICKLL